MAKQCSCGEMIEFVTLASGRLHPVETAEPEEYRVWTSPPAGVPTLGPGAKPPDAGTYSRRLVLIVAGEVLTVWQQFQDGRPIDGPAKVVGCESHYATCPHADRYRR